MSGSDQPEHLQPKLRLAEAEVARRLEETCDEIEHKDLSQESLDELLRLENELLAATRAVQETVRLRRQLGERPSTDEGGRPTPATTSERMEGAADCRLRDFTDAAGREWRVWEVRPGSTGRRINPERYLGEYVKGWLAFECESDEVRKRLPNPPDDWFDLTDADLDRLLPRAIEVPRRTPKSVP